MARFLVFLAIIYAQASVAGSPAAPFVGEDFKSNPCMGDSVGSGYGPYDYTERATYAAELKNTETHHFGPQVERLYKGQTTSISGDIFFTLTYWPNHHRALNSISLYNERLKSSGQRLSPPAECWLQRAINFSPKDSISRMLYAIYLHRAGLLEKAHIQYQKAEALAPRDMSIAYNHGLLLVEMQDYPAAKAKAEQVYAAGFPLPGLRKKLKAQGYDIK